MIPFSIEPLNYTQPSGCLSNQGQTGNIKLDINENLFHAGTTKKDNKIYATGGRVLNFVSISDNFTIAKKNIIKNLDKLNWTGGFYRKDIGYKVID